MSSTAKERVRQVQGPERTNPSNEAYKALQHEVQMAEEEIAKAEDRLLEQMVASEEYDRRIKAAEKRLKEVEESVRTPRATIESEKATAEKDLEGVEADRKRITSEIPEGSAYFDHYERIAEEARRRLLSPKWMMRKVFALCRHANPAACISKDAQCEQ